MADRDALELAREVLAAWGQPGRFLPLLAADVVIVPSVVIDEATVRGIDGVRRWLTAIADAYDVYEVVADEFLGGTTGRVLVAGSIVVRPKGVRRGHVRASFWVLTIDGDKVRSIVSYTDEPQARDAAGLPASN